MEGGSLRAADIEAWVLRIVHLVESANRIEDERVELKRDWPDPVTAARRIAAHCNATMGSSVLWIIGLDEQNGVIPVTPTELADWWQQVESCFDHLAPSVRDLIVPVGSHTVIALLFDTSRAPFVIRNPKFGSPGGGAVEREVPWREGTRVRSARRDDLVRILVPHSQLPEVEVLRGSASASPGPVQYDPTKDRQVIADPPEWLDWSLELEVYIAPKTRERLVMPVHRAQLQGSTAETGIRFQGRPVLETPVVRPMVRMFEVTPRAQEPYFDSHTILSTSSELIIEGPGLAKVKYSFRSHFDGDAIKDSLNVSVQLSIVGSTRPIPLNVNFDVPSESGRWNWSTLIEETAF